MPGQYPPLLDAITCPHCWHPFPPADALWIAASPSLRGDRKLTEPSVQKRFRPTRFSPRGRALDELGTECSQLACPKCHLHVPRVCAEVEPWFVSIFGAPSAGKSYYLAAMTHALRRLADPFRVSVTDTDAAANAAFAHYEQALFQSHAPDAVVPLGSLIAKTQETGDNYDEVLDGDQPVKYPRPLLFTVRPLPGHPLADNPDAARVMCLYDNAGESFLADRDSSLSPVTRHLGESSLLLFLFDPTQHPPFRRKLAGAGIEAATDIRSGYVAQHLVLLEAANLVRRLQNIPTSARHARPLVVIVAKQDVWGPLVPDPTPHHTGVAAGAGGKVLLDRGRIESRSQAIRKLLVELTPEVVSTAEQFAESVTYVGVSALGVRPTRAGDAGPWGVRPRDVRPSWVEIPILLGLNHLNPQLIPGGRRPGGGAA